MKLNPIIKFAKIISGQYSNREQSREDPKSFAHINIYFQPLSWKIFNGPGFYSEQSYDYLPWSPYKQSLHRVIKKDDFFIMENYLFKFADLIAGAGHHPNLLENIDHKYLELRNGCSMHFIEDYKDHYKGFIEKGNSCLIKRNNLTTYVKSWVEFDVNSWKSLDVGFDLKTNRKIWGSDQGPLIFRRVKAFDHLIGDDWLNGK